MQYKISSRHGLDSDTVVVLVQDKMVRTWTLEDVVRWAKAERIPKCVAITKTYFSTEQLICT